MNGTLLTLTIHSFSVLSGPQTFASTNLPRNWMSQPQRLAKITTISLPRKAGVCSGGGDHVMSLPSFRYRWWDVEGGNSPPDGGQNEPFKVSMFQQHWRFVSFHHSMSSIKVRIVYIHPRKSNMNPKNDGVEDVFPFKGSFYAGSTLIFGGVDVV